MPPNPKRWKRNPNVSSKQYKYNFLIRKEQGFPGGSDVKESACKAGDPDLTCESGRSPGKGNVYKLQYTGFENFMDREA